MSNFDYDYSDSELVTRGELRRQVEKTLADVGEFANKAAASRQRAIEEVSRQFPEFQQLASSPEQIRAIFESEPLLAQAIVSAENNPDLTATLPELYRHSYRAWKAGSTATAGKSEPSPESPRSESLRPGGMTEELIFSATQSSKRVDLSKANRSQVITDLEQRGIQDVEF